MSGKSATILVVVPVALVVYWAMQSRYTVQNGMNGYESWSPTPVAVAQTVASLKNQSINSRMETFCKEFKERFRNKQVAVSEQFESSSSIKLLCAAVMPKWDMARIAEALSSEASDIFKKPIAVSIYETYISMEMKQVGALTRDNLGVMNIDFATGYPKLHNRPDRSSRIPSAFEAEWPPYFLPD